jgi:hypothetical protein
MPTDMRKWARRAALALLPFVLTSAAAAQRIKPLTAQDYFEIEQLYAAYCWALDTGDGAARAATFTPDGRFLSSLSDHKGDSARAIGERTTKGGPSPYRHVMANILLTATPEGADSKAYALIVSGRTTPGTVTGTPAFYLDKLVRTPAGWRFKQREVWLDQEAASPFRGRDPAPGPLMFVRGAAASQPAQR